MQNRQYSSISQDTTLSAGGISSTATSMTVASGTGSSLMGGITLTTGDTFAVAIDPDTINEEVVFITSQSGDTFNITRGRANTTNVVHGAGATVRHVMSSDDLNWFNTTSPGTISTAKGDIVVATGSQAVDNLPVGANGKILMADSTQTMGVKWEVAPTGIPTQTGNSGKYLSTDGSNPSWQPAVSTLDSTLNAQTSTTYTVVASDVNKIVTLNNSSPITVTLPAAKISIGQLINFIQLGTGQVIFANDGTSTIVSSPGLKTRAQYSVATAICIDTNKFLLTGDITA